MASATAGQHARAHRLTRAAHDRAQRAAQQGARRAEPAPARGRRERLHQARAGDGHDLHDHAGDRLAPAKDQRVARRQVVGTRPLERAEIATLEEQALAGADGVPGGGVEVVDRVGEGEAKARGPVALAMARAGGGQTRAKAARRARHGPMVS